MSEELEMRGLASLLMLLNLTLVRALAASQFPPEA